jgi:hypothetical protein
VPSAAEFQDTVIRDTVFQDDVIERQPLAAGTLPSPLICRKDARDPGASAAHIGASAPIGKTTIWQTGSHVCASRTGRLTNAADFRRPTAGGQAPQSVAANPLPPDMHKQQYPKSGDP